MTPLGESASRLARYFDLKAEEYDERMSSPYYRLLREITWQHLRRFLPRERGARILDAGGATGYWSVRLAQAGYSVVLLDVSERMLAVAEERVRGAGLSGKVEIIQGDVADLREFREGSFAAVLGVEEPLSFSSDPEMALAEMALVTESGGTVAVSVLNRYRFAALEKTLRKGDLAALERFLDSGRSVKVSEEGSEAVSRRSYAPEEVEELLGGAGLETASAIGKPIFAGALAARLGDARAFSTVLALELSHNGNRSLWGNADVLEFVATKP